MTIKIETLVVPTDGSNTKREEFEYHAPDSYADFTRSHLKQLCSFQGKNDDLSFFLFMLEFLRIPKKIAKTLDAEQIFWCEVRYRNEEPELVYIPQLRYLQEPYANEKSLVKRILLLIGPSFRCNNLTLEQVGYCNHFATRYTETNADDDLNHFIGSAYRIPFIPFSAKRIDFISFLAKMIPNKIKRLALLNYTGLQEYYRDLYPGLYKKEESQGRSFGWSGTIRRLAQTNIHGNTDQCRKVPFPEAMLTFALGDSDRRETEKKLKQNP